MQSPSIIKYIYPLDDEGNQEIADMEASVREVENIINYKFNNKKLLEEALTHSSYGGAPSYQRLEFVGDAAMGLAFSNFIFLQYPGVDPGKLSLVRAANISTEKLARVAVRHRLYNYVRHNVNALDKKVREFVMIVEEEVEAQIYGGLVKAPKVLADIIESLAAAVYIDCNFNLEIMWKIIRGLLEPMVMLDALELQPQPVTLLFEICQKNGKQVDIKYWAKEEKIIASVFVDGQFVTSASSEQKENAKLNAAKAALQKLSYEYGDKININTLGQLNGDGEIEAAKQRLHEQCGKKKWPRPIYQIQKEDGRAHEKIYVCSVEIEIGGRVLFVTGKEKARVKDAESSAASVMLHGLKDLNYI